MKFFSVLFLCVFCMNVSAYKVGSEKIFHHNGDIIEITQNIQSNQVPKQVFDEDSFSFQAIPEVTLYPKNGNQVVWTLTLKYSDGRPAPNIPISVGSLPYTLTLPIWRTPSSMVSRFIGARAQKTASDRIKEEKFRLKAPVTPRSGKTNAQGQFSITIKNFHSCGNESTPGSDMVTAIYGGNQASHLRVKCAVNGQAYIPNNPAGGLTSAGLVGRHLHPQVLLGMRNLGRSWKNVANKPQNTPDYLVITGASMRWGGINPPHFTHKFGGTLDLRPIGNKAGRIVYGTPYYDQVGTQAIVTALVQMGATKIIFADNLTGVTHVRANHKDHLHVSFLVDPSERWFAPNDDTDVDHEGERWINYEQLNDPRYFIPTIDTNNSYISVDYQSFN